MELTHTGPDPIKLAEADVAAVRPTRVLFAIIAAIASILAIVPIYNNLLSPDAWKYMVSFDNDQFDRFFNEFTIAEAVAGTLVAWLSTVYFYRRSLRSALRRCAPKGRKPNGIADASPAAAEELRTEFRTFEGSLLGPVYAILNERSTESFVLSSGSRSWLALSVSHLMLPIEQLRFIIRHECAHLRMGDHRIIHWIPALVRGQLLAYLLCTVPLTFLAVSHTELTWLERSGYIYEDFMFGVITVTLLFTAAEILKQREIDADVSASGAPGPDAVAIHAVAGPRTKESYRNLTAILFGRLYHPAPADRVTQLTSAKAYLHPRHLLPMLGGFLIALIGNWGYAAIQPSEYEHPNAAAGWSSLEGLVQYWPRTLITLLVASAVALDILRSVGPGFRPSRAVWPALGRLCLGLTLIVPFGMLKGILAGLSAEFIISSSLSGVLMNFMTSAWQFALALWVTLVAARWCFRAIPYGFPARRLSTIAILPTVGFLFFRMVTALFYQVSGFDLYAFFFGPAIIATILLTLPVARSWLNPYLACPHCGKPASFDPANANGPLCSACGKNRVASRPDAPASKWRQLVWQALPSVAGGMFGGFFVALIPTVLALYTVPKEALANAYAQAASVSVLLACGGGIIGTVAFAAVEFRNLRRAFALLIVLLALILLVAMPPATNQLLPLAAVIGGLCLADQLRRSHPWASMLRARIVICVLCGIGLWAVCSYPIALLSAYRGYAVGVWRDIPGSPVSTTVSPLLETVRNLTDTLLVSFFLAQGITTFQAVFSRRPEATLCVTELDQETLVV
jgi:hypothetical protein